MLEPDTRQLIADALRPPGGFALERAIGTTYSLDLVTLMIAPVAFAMFDRQELDGTVRNDPIALLQTLRSHAERITIFCQAGQIAVPREYRSLFVYLEQSVYPVVPPDQTSIFHPKVWFLKFVRRSSNGVCYRLLCLSRNLTFDRSWDTVLQLDGHPAGDVVHPELESFGNALIGMAGLTMPLPAKREAAVRDLAREIACARWETPGGFDSLRFWPLGHDGQDRWPFDGKRHRMFVISPFVTSGMLGRLTKRNPGSILVTRSETLDQLGGNATAHLAERLVLSAALREPETESTDPSTHEKVAESVDGVLEGLHAKCYVADAGRRARLWTGSANCTDAAFHGNVEFLVELGGRKDRCGIEAVLGAEGNRLGLRKMLEPYVPQHPEPQELTGAEQLELLLDRARRAVGSMRLEATCTPLDDGRWKLNVIASAPLISIDAEMEAVTVAIWPLTVGAALAQGLVLSNHDTMCEFTVSEKAVTPHFAVKMSADELSVQFLVVASLIGAPANRADNVLADILKNRADVLRFLLLLLGDVDEALASLDEGSKNGEGDWLASHGTETLLEPLVIAFSRDPQRLADVGKFVDDLRKNDRAATLLPPGWDAIWQPIADALPKVTRNE